MRLDFIATCMIMIAAIFNAVSRDKLESGLAGLSMVYALQASLIFGKCIFDPTRFILECSIARIQQIKITFGRSV